MALKIKLEYECENGHWVGVIDQYDGSGPRPTLYTPHYCPHPRCASRLSPYVRNRRKSA